MGHFLKSRIYSDVTGLRYIVQPCLLFTTPAFFVTLSLLSRFDLFSSVVARSFSLYRLSFDLLPGAGSCSLQASEVITSLPEHTNDDKLSLRSRWDIVQKMKLGFWRRKKSQAGQQSKGLNSYPSPEQTSHSELPPITRMESQHLTSSRPASTPHKNANNLKELSLSTLTNNSRPGTPQDFAFTTTQHSNCRQLQYLTALIKTHANDVEKYRILTNALIYKGYYEEDPFLIETIQRLENSSMKHQQAVSEFSSHPLCDTSRCTVHITPALPQLKDPYLNFMLFPNQHQLKEKTTKMA
ncbi:hypothetical protein TNCV_459541 [Trichonephila clavipes]|nr:hypothetical protein TNCV_459541 [Trichonephila clavipes]